MPDVVSGQWLGDWQLEERLGEGGFAVVHRARHAETGEVAALKVLTDQRLATQLRREGGPSRLEHSHVVSTLAVDLDHDPPYLVLELVPGGSLRDLLAKGPLAPRRSLDLVCQIAAALDHAHGQGVLHLDVKPENVLIDGAGAARLTDFGAVSGSGPELRQSLALSQELGVAGTPDYAAPEVRYADGTVDRRADVYSLGVLAFELFTGRLPLGLDPPSELLPQLPARMDAVFSHALARDPERRTLSAGAFAQALVDAFAGPREDGAESRSVAEAASPPLRGRGPSRALALVGLLAAAAMAFFSFSSSRPSPDAAHPRVAALLGRAPAHERVGLLLPAEDLGAPARGWARDGAELFGAYPRERLRLRLWQEEGFEQLYERPQRDALARAEGCQLAVHAVIPAGAHALADDALLFLVDLPSYELRAATPVSDPRVVDLVGRLAQLDALGAPRAPLVVLPSLDAKLRVTNRSLAWLDACVTANLVERLKSVPVRARVGIVPRLRAFQGDARRALSAGSTLQCVYDHQAGCLVATVCEAESGDAVLTLAVPWELTDYAPQQDARIFSVDQLALSLLRHDDSRDALEEALDKARAYLYQHEPKLAQEVLETVRARGGEIARDLDGQLLLGRAHLDQGNLLAALGALDEALKDHPGEPRVREAYARACLDEANRLFRRGKRPWYGDDDETLFGAARALLDRLEGLELEGPLEEEVTGLRQRLEREL